METTIIDEISRYLNLDREALLKRGLKTLLNERRRAILLERLQILSRYQASSTEELERKLRTGEVQEHPAWEDLIVAENLEAELERLDGYLGSL